MKSTSRAAFALVVVAGTLVGCGGGGGGGGGRRQAANPNELRQAQAPAPRDNSDRKDNNDRKNDGSRADERRDDARDQKREDATRWDKLGERMVDGKADKDAIAVGRDDGRFKAIQLKVEGSSLEMFDVLVTFGDGSSFSPPTRLKFGNGATSRVIDLPGGNRTIKRVDFKYGNLPGGGRAQIELWAR